MCGLKTTTNVSFEVLLTVDGLLWECFVYVASDFGCSWWGGAFLYSDWAELL
jgi:hypothetical protein